MGGKMSAHLAEILRVLRRKVGFSYSVAVGTRTCTRRKWAFRALDVYSFMRCMRTNAL